MILNMVIIGGPLVEDYLGHNLARFLYILAAVRVRVCVSVQCDNREGRNGCQKSPCLVLLLISYIVSMDDAL